MLIDFHTHAFPDRLASRALAVLSKDIASAPLSDGTADGLIRFMDRSCVDRSVVCNIATNPRQTENVNRFAAETLSAHGSRLTPLGSVTPLNGDPLSVLDAIRKAGLPGIKIHPDYMKCEIDDPLFDGIFDACASLGLFIVTHAGFDVYSPDKVWAGPDRILRRLERSPRTALIAAHYGGNMMWDEVEEKLCGRELYIDTSLGGMTKLEPAQAARILSKHDPERILFGSDFPICSPGMNLGGVFSEPLSDAELENILCKNFRCMV